MHGLFTLISALVLAAPPSTLERGSRLAVIEFGNLAGLQDREIALMSDVVRTAAIELPQACWFVMTRENLREILDPATTLEDCVGNCEIETGRNIGADYVVSGQVVRFGESLRLAVKLHDTNPGKLLWSSIQAAPDVEGVEAAARRAGAELVALLRRQPGCGPETRDRREWTPGGASVGLVEFRSEPLGATVLVDGRLVCKEAGPKCVRNLAVGTHEVSMHLEMHLPRTEVVALRNGSRLEWQLRSDFGLLALETIPPGRSVQLDGRVVGTSPLQGLRIAPGPHVVTVEDACYERASRELQVRRGEEERLVLRLEPKLAGLRVMAEAESGEAVAAEVRIDGRRVGETPGTFTVGVCARSLEVRDLAGRRYVETLELEEREVHDVSARLTKPSPPPPTPAAPPARSGSSFRFLPRCPKKFGPMPYISLTLVGLLGGTMLVGGLADEQYWLAGVGGTLIAAGYPAIRWGICK